MFLARVEATGFKSFATKTTFEFLPPHDGARSITAVVGPNGSGKSNLADAIRWVLGEQSMKTLRGKKSEDVIFAGSDKKARMGYAEVSLYLVNEGAVPRATRDDEQIDFFDAPEVCVTRRLYRDGNTEYAMNGARARLSDIQLFLAKAHFGQKTYTVIGQGLIDQILLVSARERKEFFDEAAGVKEYQLKRHHALLKLHATRENIAQAETLLKEIEPRMRSLSRAVKRLEERESVEARLQALARAYYGTVWHNIARYVHDVHKKMATEETELKKTKDAHETLLVELHAIEMQETHSEVIIGLQREYETLNKQRQDLRDQELQLKTALEVSRVRAASAAEWAPLPLTKIIDELEQLKGLHHTFAKRLRGAATLGAVHAVLDEFDAVTARVEQLVKRLQRPAVEAPVHTPQDEKTSERMDELQESLLLIDQKLQELSERMHTESHREQEKKTKFFVVQRQLQSAQHAQHEVETRVNGYKIDVAKFETRAESVREEMRMEIPDVMEAVMATPPAEPVAVPDQTQREIIALKHQLELIGGIDPDIMKEFEETHTRFDFLSGQLQDLTAALQNTEHAVNEFDEILKTRREESLTVLNEKFQYYFAALFRGGAAKLVPLYLDPRELERAAATDDEEHEEDIEEKIEAATATSVSHEPVLVGIDIQAQPPGKRIKDISILSGGERAMTSVALICAIMASNPSPFVVLDEVDAALDEANSVRFSDIVEELARHTQFIVITHNRATMAKADILYGVTMGNDGMSQLLSVKFEEASRWAK